MWSCPKCRAKVDDTFEVCWSCGTSPDGEEDPTFTRADDAGPILDPPWKLDHKVGLNRTSRPRSPRSRSRSATGRAIPSRRVSSPVSSSRRVSLRRQTRRGRRDGRQAGPEREAGSRAVAVWQPGLCSTHRRAELIEVKEYEPIADVILPILGAEERILL
jgi:hypothetical protein